jgi:hypothetical protein
LWLTSEVIEGSVNTVTAVKRYFENAFARGDSAIAGGTKEGLSSEVLMTGLLLDVAASLKERQGAQTAELGPT